MAKSLFWHRLENRLRAPWRLLAFLLVGAAFANPLVLLLDSTDDPWLESSLENICSAVGFLLALVIAARYFERRPLRDFGITGSLAGWRDGLAGFFAGAALPCLIVAVLYGRGVLELTWGPYSAIDEVSATAAWFGQALRYLGGSVVEEVFGRAYLLRWFAEGFRNRVGGRRRSVLFAVVVTSVLFGALHLLNDGAGWVSTLNISTLGVLFALPLAVSGRLAGSIGLHMGWNIAQSTIFGLPNGGKPARASLFQAESSGSDLWTGGGFGPEGSLVTLAVLVITLVLCSRVFARVRPEFADPPSRA